MIKNVTWLFTGLACATALAACGGGGGGSSTVPTTPSGPSSSPAYVSFVVNLSGPAPALRRPKFTAPSNTQSLTFTLVSTSGSMAGESISFNVSSSNCTPAVNPTSCTFTIPAAVGSDVFEVTTYSQPNEQGTATGSGTITVTATAGQTTIAPATLSGQIASIALQVAASVPQGNATAVPLLITAKDASGNTIIGTYQNAITLSLTDASGQTALSATSIPDSATASSVTLNYKGGVMASPASISAAASGVTTSTGATFIADNSHPLVNGATLSYQISLVGLYGGGSFGPTPPPILSGEYPTVSQETVTESTGVSFNGQTNAIQVATVVSPSPGPSYELDSFYSWNSGTSNSTLQYLGGKTSGGYVTLLGGVTYSGGTTNTTCAAPYQTAWIAPAPASWDALSQTGACTTTGAYSDSSYSTEYHATLNADGSYTMTNTELPSIVVGQATASADGTANGWVSYVSNGGPGGTNQYQVYNYVMGTPAPNSTSIPATQVELITTTPVGVPSPGATLTPAPIAMTFPNWYLAAGLPDGKVPQPLRKDLFTSVGSIGSLPASCAVPSNTLGSSPTVSEVDETNMHADPFGAYENDTYRYFSVAGIGVVCVIENSQLDSDGYLSPTSTIGGYYAITTTSLTSSTLAAAQSRTRSKAEAMHMVQAGIFAVVREHDEVRRAEFTRRSSQTTTRK